jgi:hypothetical protein
MARSKAKAKQPPRAPPMVEESPRDESRKKIIKSINIILKAARMYGFNTDLYRPENTVEHWTHLASLLNDDWVATVKWKLTSYYAYHKQQETLPELPEAWSKDPVASKEKPSILLGGSFYRWQHKILRSEEASSWLETILNSKRGMPLPTTRYLEAAKIKTVTALTRTETAEPKPQLIIKEWGDPRHEKVETTLSKQTIQAQLRRTVHELFDNAGEYSYSDRMAPFFPSTSANYINNRQEAGAIGSILEHPTLLKGLRQRFGYVRMREVLRGEQEPVRYNGVAEVEMDIQELERNFRIFWFRLLKKASTERPDVEPVALAESLKVRVISKGPPFTYTVLRSLWKFIHTTLRKHRVFQLIGEPVSEEYMLKQLGDELNKDEEFVSGDYQAATDNLESWVSECISDTLSETLKLAKVERSLFRRALTGHFFNGVPQRHGQLMGSIVSFPVLCIANAAVSRWSMEVAEGREILLSEARLAINGDDVALRSNKEAYNYWRTITNAVGLKESLGKTFRSTKFVNINSTNFELQEVPHRITMRINNKSTVYRDCRLTQTKYVNLGLVVGNKRSQGPSGLNDQNDPSNNIGMRARELIRLCPEQLQEPVMKEFLKYHSELLQKMRLPWYIPDWLGGLGLPLGSPSDVDLRLAALILRNWSKERPTPLCRSESPWKLRKMAEKQMRQYIQPTSSTGKDSGVNDYNRAAGTLVVNLLFDSRHSISDLKQEVVGSKVSRLIAHNARLWSPAGKNLPPPLTEEEIKFNPRYDKIYLHD